MRHRLISILCMIFLVIPLASAGTFEVFNFSDSSQSYFFINGSTGRVGVGTSLPTQALDIIGNVNITGNATFGQKITFAFGEIIDNLIDGWITITGSLNVTGNISLPDGNIFTNATSLFYNNGSEAFDLTKGSSSGSSPENTISAFNQASCPTGWVLADGSSGTPDLRGIFVRGAGTSGSYNASNGTAFTASFGEFSNDSFQGHRHDMDYDMIGDFGTARRIINSPGAGASVYSVGDPTSDGTNADPRTSYETAPASYGLIYCMKTATEDSSNFLFQKTGDLISLANVTDSLNINDTLIVNSTDNSVRVSGDFIVEI